MYGGPVVLHHRAECSSHWIVKGGFSGRAHRHVRKARDDRGAPLKNQGYATGQFGDEFVAAAVKVI
jgi:hypothetical protein